MKVPPWCMYTAQLVRTLVAGIVNLAVAWWMPESIENICDGEALHPETPWTCPKFRVAFYATVIQGLIGPKQLFGSKGMYHNLLRLCIIGAVLALLVRISSKMFPNKKWIAMINIPLNYLRVFWNATGNPHQHCKLACNWNRLQLFSVPIPQKPVPEI
ncbi:OPT domain-containing protein [Cephalotus follicularis]|uniref:OPT domain-containing protein n=1 Tax=Cephalotus follicularis TaxID=3775 RepID=A0A1Q3AVQ7_CEPFO|nr:OPT domain-containing protein [Cephalotus follicularis]